MRIKALDVDPHARFYRLVDLAIVLTPPTLLALAARSIARRFRRW